jgi:hypothetical protein
MRYFFNYRTAKALVLDTEGTELLNGAAAREEGRVSARELMGLDRGGRSRKYRGGSFEINDAAGLLIGIIAFREASLA